MLTQLRAFGALAGARYGSFAGKRITRHIPKLTEPRAFGAYTGRRYGSFAGKPESPPVVEVAGQEIPQAIIDGAFAHLRRKRRKQREDEAIVLGRSWLS